MDPADDEINILLPLVFGIIILIPALAIGLFFLILIKTNAIEIKNKNNLIKVLKAASFSLAGVISILVLIRIVVFIIEMIKNFFVK